MSDAPAPVDEAELLDELRGARAAGRTIPDFFVVGHAKSGTTSLHAMLGGHPGIFMPALRETEFLARGPRQRRPPEGARRPVRPRALAGYLELFDGAAAGQRVGEISTAYLRTPETAARIAALRPDAQIIAFFREPASFVRSFHLQQLQVGIETERDLARALALEPERAAGRHLPPGEWPQSLLYTRHVDYAAQLRAYRELFGAERVLALIYERFRADNEAVVRQIFRFLGVDEDAPIARSEANPTVRVRIRGAGRLLDAVASGRGPVTGAVGAAVKAVTPRALRRAAVRAVEAAAVEHDPAPADAALVAELHERFEGEAVALAELLGDEQVLSLWGYGPGRRAPGGG